MSDLTHIEKSDFSVPSDALAECLRVVLSFYSIHADIEGIITEIPRDAGPLQPEDVLEVGRKLSLRTILSPDKDNLRETLDIPVIVFLENKGGCVVFPQRTHGGKIFMPGRGFLEQSWDDIRNEIRGDIILIYPADAETAADTKHMWKAHAVDWFWKPITSHWSNYAEIILCSIFINLIVIALPLYTMNIYDRVVPTFAEATLFVLTSGIILALLFDFVLKIIRSYILETVASRVGSQFDFDFMERLLLIRPQDMQMSVGEKFNLFKELQAIRDFYASKMAPALVDLPFCILFLLIIYIISPVLFLVPFFGTVIVLLANLFAQVPITMTTKKTFSSMQRKSNILVETLSGMQTFKMFNATGSRLSRWKLVVTQSSDMVRHSQFIMGAAGNVSGTVMNLVYVLIIFFGVFQIHEHALTVGGLVACTTLSGRAIAPIVNVAAVLGRLKQSADVLKTIDAIFKLPYEGDDILHNSAKGPFLGRVEMRDVTYKYPGQMRPAIVKASLIIKPGERVGLIGKSGAGKTTLAGLVTGGMRGYDGQIFLDDFSLEAIAPTELRRSVAVVPQTSFYFGGTIRENVVMGREDVDEAILAKAIQMSGLDLTLRQMGQGMDTQVGENGMRLSGGQRQAIALARAFLRDPRILIFDEPTTGMDQMLEQKVRQSLQEFLVNRTFIMITHRTSLLSLVDRLILIDEGRITADGPRDAILQKLSGQG